MRSFTELFICLYKFYRDVSKIVEDFKASAQDAVAALKTFSDDYLPKTGLSQVCTTHNAGPLDWAKNELPKTVSKLIYENSNRVKK